MARFDYEKFNRFCKLLEQGKERDEILLELGIAERTYYTWRKKAKYEQIKPPQLKREIDDIIKVRKEIFKYEKQKDQYFSNVPIKFKENKAIGILFMGDPHLDNQATDLELFEKHLELARKNENVFIIGLGDYLDNWVGYLSKLFAKHSITQEEAFALLKYYFDNLHILACVLGNHDVWNLFEVYFREVLGEECIVAEDIRLNLQFPNDTNVTIRMRHSFSGRSQYNPAFPLVKQAIFNKPDDIICMGHTHQFGYQMYVQPDNKISHCFVVGSYKRFDEYGKKFMTHDTNITPAVLAVINPSDSSFDRIKLFLDIEKGIEYLNFLNNS